MDLCINIFPPRAFLVSHVQVARRLSFRIIVAVQVAMILTLTSLYNSIHTTFVKIQGNKLIDMH